MHIVVPRKNFIIYLIYFIVFYFIVHMSTVVVARGKQSILIWMLSHGSLR